MLIYGLGGVGKSQLALKFLQEHQEEFKKVFWVTAETRERLLLAYRLIGQDHGVFTADMHVSTRYYRKNESLV